MTAIKPIENRRVHGVQLGPEQYPLNKCCAHPECNEETADPHHCFPRSAIGNAYWYVEIELRSGVSTEYLIIPHVVGLCRAHHDDVEEHHAWIKLEDGEFVWYDRYEEGGTVLQDGTEMDDATGRVRWERVGPLNPQPGSREGKPKRKRFMGEKKRKRATISLRVPQDAQEDGAGTFDDLAERVEALLSDPLNPRPVYYTIVDSFNYVLLNEGGTKEVE